VRPNLDKTLRVLIKEFEIKRRNKWILIAVLIVALACGITPLVYLGYSARWITRDLKNMEERRPLLLYETDHQKLLEACREISRQVTTGQLEPGSYQIKRINPDPRTRQFPQLILNLLPLHVEVKKNGLVDIVMSPVVMYGVVAYPENYGNIHDDSFKYKNRLWSIELIDGLLYYDEDFQNNPERMKEVEELLKKRKSQ
jgi:hypothetical protein